MPDIKDYTRPYEHIDLWYRQENKNTVARPHKKLFKTRKTGRLGNQLFEYMFWFLMTLNHSGTFKNTYDQFPRPFDKIPKTMTIKKSEKMDLGLDNYHELIPGYPMNFKYFKDSRNLLRKMLNIESFSKKYDIVIHVRLDDVFNDYMAGTDYTVLPLSFYYDCIQIIIKEHGPINNFKILLIGRPIDSFQEKIFDDLYKYIKKISGSKDVSKQSGSVSEDMIAIMSSKILIGSTSSFWCWPSLLSNVSKEIHIPVFGQTFLYHYFDENSFIHEYKNIEYITRTLDLDYKIYGYLIKTDRIRANEINKMYDKSI